ncbi:tyrosine-type recombinase/integrase [Streptomyces sp. NPDC057582]|uniref:tyrosine-type recombinase/integrase n=1 Tax=Streptomyces sp. NPDC057582 TaxID=3346174 RepID=UPI0036BD2709
MGCDVRDENGLPVHLTPHQWRHTFATRLMNRDVPQGVVRVLLDHDSHQMTAHYARITDQTVRRRWEAATKVNIRGERVTIAHEGPLAQAEWAKTRYGVVTRHLRFRRPRGRRLTVLAPHPAQPAGRDHPSARSARTGALDTPGPCPAARLRRVLAPASGGRDGPQPPT